MIARKKGNKYEIQYRCKGYANIFEAMKEENRDPNANQTEKIIGLLKEKPKMTENLLNLLSMMVS